MHYSPISLEYFLNMEIQHGGGGKEIIHQNGSLTKIQDIVNYFKTPHHVNKTKSNLNPTNWQYFNCMFK